MPGRVGGQTSSAGQVRTCLDTTPREDRPYPQAPVVHHARGQAVKHAGAHTARLVGRTSPTKHAGEPVPPTLLRRTSHIVPGSGAGTPHHHLQGQWGPRAGKRKSGILATFFSLMYPTPVPLGI
jgi:hypothetical protein